MTEHTPTPWSIYDKADSCHVKIMGRYPDSGGAHVADVLTPGNAAFIVEAVNDREALQREIDRLQEALKELHAMVMGECPSLLDEDSGGNARLDADIHALLDPMSSEKGNGNE
jgi:hypothetical protein